MRGLSVRALPECVWLDHYEAIFQPTSRVIFPYGANVSLVFVKLEKYGVLLALGTFPSVPRVWRRLRPKLNHERVETSRPPCRQGDHGVFHAQQRKRRVPT